MGGCAERSEAKGGEEGKNAGKTGGKFKKKRPLLIIALIVTAGLSRM